jgi:hypothetical protein
MATAVGMPLFGIPVAGFGIWLAKENRKDSAHDRAAAEENSDRAYGHMMTAFEESCDE